MINVGLAEIVDNRAEDDEHEALREARPEGGSVGEGPREARQPTSPAGMLRHFWTTVCQIGKQVMGAWLLATLGVEGSIVEVQVIRNVLRPIGSPVVSGEHVELVIQSTGLQRLVQLFHAVQP